ncbi:DNA mismatch repair protein MutS [Galbibacter sp. CMA-7]|uniref:DNA mismatch repair protein MutS n=2 Tax=Galbibacter pacificus TaxID=2996052 RepID=A0ABT6FSY0_9FLAO|nr:DNA mismatch repair protein MutS [Galbibacter pacificus]MDG3582675.1 DNA mismatch repair protein MutS [Galbibacter pacificus]MDG3586206.1 DNA mismatch repair protein MutS [Galbibacter pacificus]
MKNPSQYYKNKLQLFNQQYTAVKKSLVIISFFRLLSFLLIVFFIYWFWGVLSIMIPCIIVSIALFLFLVTKYSVFKYKRDKIRERIHINKAELKVLEKNFSFLPSGKEFSNYTHDYSHDIDLFGKGSFFQYSNRTATKAGTETLANLYAENAVDRIPEKQEAIRELAKKVEWRQDYSATATLVKVKVSAKKIAKWLQSHQPIVKKSLVWLPYAFSACSMAIITLAVFNIVPSSLIMYWFVLGLGVSGSYVKKVNQLAQNTSKAQDTFQQYHQLIAKIESETFSSTLLKEKQQIVLGQHKSTSLLIKKFSKALDALEQRANILISIPANAFLLMDLYNIHRIEKWIHQHKNKVEKWFEVIAFFDAYNSLGNFTFNHPHYAFPAININETVINAKAMGHPLIQETKLVYNDFKIIREHFFVITGANMAGKSTFLRTVSLHIVMANCGLPVCAASSEYSPIKLITSMRTADSLTDDASYFYAELKRLKLIVDKIKTDTYFVVLDEILKGTNSKDKAIGSKKFIQKLSASRSTGIIATHDLSLCQVANNNDKVANYFFEAFIDGKALTFDYTFKEGICENMNASFLLENMGIV